MRRNLRTSFPYLCVFIFLAIPFSRETTYQYVVIAAFSAILILQYHKSTIRVPLRVERIPVIIFVIWMYGVFMGIVRGNNAGEIVQNFAGMAIFILYYVVANINQIRMQLLFKAIYHASILVSLEVIVNYVLNVRGITPPWPLSNIYYNRWTSSVYAITCCISFVLEAVSLFELIHAKTRNKRVKNLLLLLIASAALLVTTDSGGFLLGYIVIFGTVVFYSVLNGRRNRRDRILAIVIFLLILAGVLFYGVYRGSIYDIFSVNTIGNEKRYYQFQLVFERFRFFGNGLGAKFEYYVGRSRYETYGIEVSYLNLIDKFGVLGFLLIFEYCYLFLKPILMLFQRCGDNYLNIAALGLQGYLFVALGNPVLYAPYNVCLQLIAIFFLAKNLRDSGINR